jgi:hypothetical protein
MLVVLRYISFEYLFFRYIADNYSREERTGASALFVTYSALGMSAGPALAAALDYLPDTNVLGVRLTVETAPGWLMACTIRIIRSFHHACAHFLPLLFLC